MFHISGHASSYQNWPELHRNLRCQYFARHHDGESCDYQFNSQGFRGPEFHRNPDIVIIGSSFSFGVGLKWEECWHQNLGNYRINCYAFAGFAMTNNDILDFYHGLSPQTKTILQFREYSYDTDVWEPPKDTWNFIVDQHPRNDILCFDWQSWLDRARDRTHPGPLTHKSWTNTIKKTWNL